MKKFIISFLKLGILPLAIRYRVFLLGSVIHTLIFWAALVCGFNSYKEFIKQYEPLTGYEKDAIIGTFPWMILFFLCLYFFLFWFKKKKGTIFLGILQYICSITFCVVIVNLFLFSDKKYQLISFNFSIFYFVLFLVFLWGVCKLSIIPKIKIDFTLRDWMPPIVYRFLARNQPPMQVYIAFTKKRLALLFAILFVGLLVLCAFFQAISYRKTSEIFASAAYFTLIISVGIGIYEIIRKRRREGGFGKIL
jgi:hypothetical protein